MPLFNSISCCNDDFEISKIGDVAGDSVGSNALAATILDKKMKSTHGAFSYSEEMFNLSLQGAFEMCYNITITSESGIKISHFKFIGDNK